MAKFFKEVRMENLDFVKSQFESQGFKVRAFPLRQKGLNQSNFRKLEIQNEGSLSDVLKRSKWMKEQDFSNKRWW